MAKQENLSQRVLLEVLTKEIETLKQSTKSVKETVPVIEDYVRKIEKTQIKVDASAVEEALKGKTTLPTWLVTSFAILAFLAVVTSVTTFYFWNESGKWEKTARTWYNKAVELGYKEDTNQN